MLKLLVHGVGFYFPGGVIGPACWPHHDLIMVAEGTVDYVVGRRRFHCTPGDALLVPPGCGFSGEAGTEGATIWVQHFACEDPAWKKWLDLPKRAAMWPGAGRWEWPRTLMRRLSRAQQGSPRAVAADRAAGLLLAQLLEELQRTAGTTPASGPEHTIQVAIDWIEHHALPLPSLREIAAFAGWSVSYFRDQFRAVEGYPVGAFLRQRRMSEAARLLVETRRPIKEIATQAGYAEVAAFHRAFHDRYKVTPGQYRDRQILMA